MNTYLFSSVCMCEKKANLSDNENWPEKDMNCIFIFLKYVLNSIDVASEQLNTIVVPITLNRSLPLHSEGIEGMSPGIKFSS